MEIFNDINTNLVNNNMNKSETNFSFEDYFSKIYRKNEGDQLFESN